MKRIPEETLMQIARELALAKHGEKAEIRKKWESKLGISWSTIWRKLKKMNGKAKRGVGRKVVLPLEKQKEVVFKIKAVLESSIHGQGKELPIDWAIKLLRLKGLLDVDVTATQYLRWVKKFGLGQEVYIPKRFRRSKPNDLWQFDFTGGKVFYPVGPDKVKVKGRLYTTGYYKDKTGGNLKVWLGMFKDDYSGCVTGKLIIRAGEDWEAATELFLWATDKKDLDSHLPYGIPAQLYTDPAPWAHRKSPFVLGLQRLGVICFAHAPGRAQAKGKIERFFLSEQKRLENLWGFMAGKVLTISEVNERLWKFLKSWNRRPHPELNKSKWELWVTGARQNPITLAPDGVKEVFYRVEEREAKGWRIRYKGKVYRAPAERGHFEIYELNGAVYAFDPETRLRYQLVEFTFAEQIPDIHREYEEFKESWDFKVTLDDIDRLLEREFDDSSVIYLPPREEELHIEDEHISEPILEGTAQIDFFLKKLGRYYEIRGLSALPPILRGEVEQFLNEPHRESEVESYAARIRKILDKTLMEVSYG